MPEKVEGMDMEKYDLSNFYTPEQVEEYAGRLIEERKAHLASFAGLNERVVNAIS
jgi:hypothetical protein